MVRDLICDPEPERKWELDDAIRVRTHEANHSVEIGADDLHALRRFGGAHRPRDRPPSAAPTLPSHEIRPASLPPQDSVLELKRQLHAAKRSLYPERQRLTLPPKTGEARGAVLEDDKRLAEYGLKDGDAVLFKDLGPQVSTMTAWRRG